MKDGELLLDVRIEKWQILQRFGAMAQVIRHGEPHSDANNCELALAYEIDTTRKELWQTRNQNIMLRSMIDNGLGWEDMTNDIEELNYLAKDHQLIRVKKDG